MKLLKKRIVLLFEMFFRSVFNSMASFTNVALITASACKFIRENIVQK